ncbi:hypothetical protein TNCV_1349261 [Trichonephila clavipes]|nr:hypothetical protein TNCV_1349261 [Trichonephila clavipes]
MTKTHVVFRFFVTWTRERPIRSPVSRVLEEISSRTPVKKQDRAPSRCSCFAVGFIQLLCLDVIQLDTVRVGRCLPAEMLVVPTSIGYIDRYDPEMVYDAYSSEKKSVLLARSLVITLVREVLEMYAEKQ